MSRAEELNSGTRHAAKIGSIVTVHIQGGARIGVRGGLIGKREGDVLISGVLEHIEDSFESDELAGTKLVVGGALVIIDWDTDRPCTIETVKPQNPPRY